MVVLVVGIIIIVVVVVVVFVVVVAVTVVEITVAVWLLCFTVHSGPGVRSNQPREPNPEKTSTPQLPK